MLVRTVHRPEFFWASCLLHNRATARIFNRERKSIEWQTGLLENVWQREECPNPRAIAPLHRTASVLGLAILYSRSCRVSRLYLWVVTLDKQKVDLKGMKSKTSLNHLNLSHPAHTCL